MTRQTFEYRTNPLFLRNGFYGLGNYEMPIIPKFKAKPNDFTGLRLIGFDKTKLEDEKHTDRMVHFFLYDNKFEKVWDNPDAHVEKLRRYRAVLTPDFSMYIEMPKIMQLYNTFRNRWCGAYFASKGLRVIPTINFALEDSFNFCFDGIPKGSTVAVSTYMVRGKEHHDGQKAFFLTGYREMLHRIEPERILCYHEPFPEMQGNIVYINYDLSSWRHMDV